MPKCKPEAQTIEYKSSWHDDYFEWISGYANAKGGTLYIGVNDDGYVVGVKDVKYLLDKLPNRISRTKIRKKCGHSFDYTGRVG